jgi:excisionase family DNA binding protein
MTETQTALAADRLLGVNEVAELLNQAPKTIRKYAKTGVLPAFQIVPRGQLKFRRRDVERLINADKE